MGDGIPRWDNIAGEKRHLSPMELWEHKNKQEPKIL
jgi:hypothetical protein